METTEKLYRVAVGGNEIGSYSVEELRSYWQGGSLDRAAVYLHEGTQQWKPVSQMFGPMTRMPSASPSPGASPRLGRSGAVLVKPQKSRGVYILLGLFLGGLGVHNFYVGRYGSAVAQLLIALALGWLIVPLLFLGLWVLIEMFVVKNDGDGDPLG